MPPGRGFEVEVPAGAKEVSVEAFNYYSQGEVCWDSLHVRSRQEGNDLLKNADFSSPEGQRPAAWRANTFSTEAVMQSFAAKENAKYASGAIVPEDAKRPGSVTVALESPFLVVRASVVADGADKIEVSTDGGKGFLAWTRKTSPLRSRTEHRCG